MLDIRLVDVGWVNHLFVSCQRGEAVSPNTRETTKRLLTPVQSAGAKPGPDCHAWKHVSKVCRAGVVNKRETALFSKYSPRSNRV